MLAEYLHAAKVVVQAKQARPGVAIHVRLGDISIGVDQEDGYIIDSIDRVGSYAVWAVTAGRGTTYDVVRVACSEMAQTEVPRSAIQRVQVRLVAYKMRMHMSPVRHESELLPSIYQTLRVTTLMRCCSHAWIILGKYLK